MFEKIRQQAAEAAESKKMGINADVMYKGTIVSSPGTENVVLSLKNISLMKCKASGDINKTRCCVVLKNPARHYNNEFVDSNGDAVEVIKQRVFDELQLALSEAARKIQDLKRELERTTNERDAYKLSIDALRHNGVID